MLYQLVIMCCTYVLWKLWLKKKACLEPPDLPGWLPIVGHGLRLLGDGVIIADPDDCLTVMKTCLNKSYVLNFFKPFLGNGLLLADVERWKISRRLLNPAFNQKVLDSFIEIFNTQAEYLVHTFATEIGKPFDHEKLLRMNILETICSTSFEINANEYSDIFKQYVPLYTKSFNRINSRVQKFWFHNDHIYNMTREKKLLDKDVNGLITLSKTIIQNKKAERKRQNNSITEHTTGEPKKFIDIIMDVAEETGCFTDEQIREETDTIIFAGHDTTASTLTYALTLLGSHADVQEKLHEEILRVCGNSENICKNDLTQLVYTEAVLKETLRLYPVGLILPRYINKDVKLKNFTLKANNDCLLSIHGLHRHSMWGPDADQFRPERWLDKETLPDLKYYGAFGLGRRSCIGKVYAMMSMKILLSHVLRNYLVSSDISKMVVPFNIMSRPESGYFISLEKREIQ